MDGFHAPKVINWENVTSESYKEIFKLAEMLDRSRIPYTLVRRMDGFQLCYPDEEVMLVDAVQFRGTYGANQDLLGVYGRNWDRGPEGCLTASEALEFFVEEHIKILQMNNGFR